MMVRKLFYPIRNPAEKARRGYVSQKTALLCGKEEAHGRSRGVEGKYLNVGVPPPVLAMSIMILSQFLF